eukprot:Em0001g789a
MEDLGTGGREGKGRLNDDVSSRGDQKSSHHHKTTSSSSPNHSSTSPHSTSSPYVHPPPPSQPPPPPPPSQSRHVTGKSRPQQQQQQMTLQGDPPLMGRGFPQEKSWDSSQVVGRKEEGVASAKTTKLLGSDIHHQVTSRVFPPPPLPPSSSSSHPLVGSHDDRQRRSSSPDQDSWHTSSDTYLPSRVGGDDQLERESSLTQSYSPQMPHHRHDNQLHASNSDTKLMVSAPSSSSPSSSTSSPSFLSRPRGGAGEGSMGAEPPKGAETTRVVMNSKAEGRATHRGGRNDYILTRIVNRSDGSGGSPSHQKAGQQLLLSNNQSSPQAQSNLALQSGPQSNQPLQSSQPAQPLPPQPHVNRAEEVPQQADREAPVDQGRTQTKVTTSSPQAVSLSPEAQRDTNPPPPSSSTSSSSTSASSTMHDTSPVSSSTEELSKFHEEADEDSTTTTTTNVLIRPTASVPSNHVHQRGAQPLPPQPPPQTYFHHQHHVRPTYGPQVGGSGGGRGLDGFPLPAPTTTTTTSLPQTRPVPSQQQYEKVFFGTELQPLYHRPPGGVLAKVPHDYQPPVDDHYLMSLSSEPFGSPQGGQGPPMLPAGGGGHKSQSRLVRVDPAQMMGSKTKVTIAHDAAVKGDVATLRFLLSSHEIDPVCSDESGSTLVHKASQCGHLAILRMLCSDLPLAYMQAADSNFDTPAMLAIQGGHVECLQYLIQEGGVPLEVKDAGGETLLHHAAYHGQHRCLELLLKLLKATQKTDQPTEILDDSGVTPAHFAAQRGHLECLQLLMNYGYSVILPDREGQKPSDWADAMGQAICTRYLIMVETSWALSLEVSRLGEQVHILRKQNEQLKEVLKFQEQEHRVAVGKLQQEHDLRVTRMKEQYIDLTASLLKDIGQNTKIASVDQKDGTRTQQPVHGKKADAPPQGGKGKLPPGTEVSGKRKPLRSAPAPERSAQVQARDGEAVEQALDEMDYRATTPQEVLRRQMTSVEQRMNASREIRKKQPVMATLACAPQSPSEAKATDKPPNKSQHHTSEQQERRPMKVKFAANVTEISPPERQGSKQQAATPTSSPLHTSSAQSSRDSTSSDSAATNGSDSRSHQSSEPSHSRKS